MTGDAVPPGGPPAQRHLVDEQGRVLDDRVACPKCETTPGQMLGGYFVDPWHVIRYRCTDIECGHEFEIGYERSAPSSASAADDDVGSP
ncbi:MAG TPA: hypothetical protein VJ914_40235 [Pseudonocardiaceae bacterium]|nr:hypothetical protein [Pseudonocardiaceae bacterium]